MHALFFRRQCGIADEGLQVFIEDFVLLVRKILETCEGVIQFRLGTKFDAQFLHAGLEGVASGMFAQHHAIGRPANVLGAHDFVGFTMLEHAVLVDAGLMSKGIGADNRLIGLHREAGNTGHKLGAGHDFTGIDVHMTGKHVLAGRDRHDHFFQCRIAGSLTETVDGALHLTGTVQHGGQ